MFILSYEEGYLAGDVIDDSHEDFRVEENAAVLGNGRGAFGVGGHLLHNFANTLREVADDIYFMVD